MRRLWKKKKLISIVMAIVMVVAGINIIESKVQAEDSYTISNPRIHENGPSVWDCVWFGRYWQKDTNGNGNGRVNQDDDMLPIKWRVLSVEDDELFLVADQNLDVVKYNEVVESVTWKTCTMRSWLNGYGTEENYAQKDYSDNNFIDVAFTQEEQSFIADTLVVNTDNPEYETMGGKNTTDKIYLLSADEITNPSYGFDIDPEKNSESRISYHSKYVYYGGAGQSNTVMITEVAGSGNSNYWWLRTPGQYQTTAVWVDGRGEINLSGFGNTTDYFAVRPALHIKKSALENGICTYAGIVESDEDQYEAPGAETHPDISSTRIDDDGKVTWDCIWFGNYWQNDTTGDGNADQNDVKEPIRWRVLEREGDDLFLVSDQNLDVMNYNNTETDVTWETCALRSWLNGYDESKNIDGIDYSSDNFLKNAFTAEEQKAISDTNVINRDNPDYRTEAGNSTVDKLFCLSYDELKVREYGFLLGGSLRQSSNTGYVSCKEIDHITKMNEAGWYDNWWLRTPGDDNKSAVVVSEYGGFYNWGQNISWTDIAVRPALHLNLEVLDPDLWSYAGTVSRYNGGKVVLENEMTSATPSAMPTDMPEATPKETSTVTPAGTPEPTLEATATVTPTDTPQFTPGTTTTAVPAGTPDTTGTHPAEEPGTGDRTKKQQVGVVLDDENFYTAIRSAKLNKNNAPEIRWKSNSKADGYQLFRSKKKMSGYKLVKNITSAKVLRYIDKKTVGKKRYYYRIRCYKKNGTEIVYGKLSQIVSIKTLNLVRPRIKATKGITATNIPFIVLTLKKYKGTKVFIYYRTGKKAFQRLKLSSSSIRKNHRKFKIRCGTKRRTYYFKVKTCLNHKKKTYYSKFSNTVKITR